MAPNRSSRASVQATATASAPRHSSTRFRSRLAPSPSVAAPRARGGRPARPAAAPSPPPADDDDDDDDDEEEEEQGLEGYDPAAALPPNANPSRAFRGLVVLPPLRRPILRPSQGAINSDRMVNREAFLA